MKLQTKSIIVICIGFSILSLVLSLTLTSIISGSYSDLESNTVSEHVGRVLNQFNQEYNNLAAIAYDWSVWDDTYSFINDTNKEYIQWNLQYEIFYDIDINFMLFYNNSDALVFSKAFDFNQGHETLLPSSLYTYINENKKSFFYHSTLNFSQSGIVFYDNNETPLIISITPVLHTNNEGPIQGTLIVGRFLNTDRITSIANITQLSIIIHPLSSRPPIDFRHASSSIQGKPIFIQPINSTYIAGYVSIDDLFGNPVLILEIGSNRDIFNQGMTVIQHLIISLFITMIVLLIIVVIVLNRFVTSRLIYLSKSLNDIKNYNDLSKHLDVKGNDEIALLEKNINTMLTSLQKTWAMKDTAESSLQKKIDELERFKTITVDRELKMIDLKKQIEELKTKERRDDLG
jgi:sensor domain CHASE-containing protein